jgi:hypothetical protein
MSTGAVNTENQRVAVRCASCERQLIVTYRPSSAPGDATSAVRCLFCDHENVVELAGPIVSVSVQDLRKPR